MQNLQFPWHTTDLRGRYKLLGELMATIEEIVEQICTEDFIPTGIYVDLPWDAIFQQVAWRVSKQLAKNPQGFDIAGYGLAYGKPVADNVWFEVGKVYLSWAENYLRKEIVTPDTNSDPAHADWDRFPNPQYNPHKGFEEIARAKSVFERINSSNGIKLCAYAAGGLPLEKSYYETILWAYNALEEIKTQKEAAQDSDAKIIGNYLESNKASILRHALHLFEQRNYTDSLYLLEGIGETRRADAMRRYIHR